MSAVLNRALTAARFNAFVQACVTALPLAVAPGLYQMATRSIVAAVLTVVAFAGVIGYGLWRAKTFDRTWLVRRLNARRPDMEDSADLLYAGDARLNPLQQMQRARLSERLTAAGPDLRPEWHWRPVAVTWGILAVLAVVAVAVALLLNPDVDLTAVRADAKAKGAPVLISQTLTTTPPAYTGIAVRSEAVLDIKAPQGTRIDWRLTFTPQTKAVDLVFHDGKRIAMTRSGDAWTASLVLTQSTLYRVEARDAKAGALHRLDAIVDTPPQIKIVTPDRSLTLVTPGQTTWPLVFEVSDDYGVSASARLHITLAQGEGENITFRDHDIVVAGVGDTRQKRFATRLDLTKLGFVTGNDLIAQLSVSDTRSPGPQTVRSPSLILRWPSDLGNESTGVEGLVRKTLPAYFRSQRQIIIDIEALLKEKRKLSADAFLARSDSIGVDQRILRLRYGQFLGEEAEGEKTSEGLPAEHHDEPPGQSDGGFGADNGLEALYGHVHDESEAATLLDPETRATLKKALDEMWQSELHLRQGNPDLALPHAYKALGYIKAVQQATRIYLSRVGPELPPIDEARRMTGKREGIADRPSDLAARPDTDAPVVMIWTALAGTKPVDMQPLESWMRANESRVADPLSIYAAMDTVRRDPACQACRADLRGKLWAVLSRPPSEVARRPRTDASGNRYLDALRGGGE